VRKIIKMSGNMESFLAKIQTPGLSNVKQKIEPRSSLYESQGWKRENEQGGEESGIKVNTSK
jgi:hypothetical protein